MDRVIICGGKKVSLGILSREDAPDLFRMINDRDVNRMLRSPPPINSLVEEYEWIDNQSIIKGKNLNLGIVDNQANKLIGVIGVNNMESNMYGTLGYFLHKDSWGKGFGTEAIQLIVEYCFNVLNMRKITANAYEPNTGSIRVLEKNGFKMNGRQEEHLFIENHGFVDSLYFEKLNPNRQRNSFSKANE